VGRIAFLHLLCGMFTGHLDKRVYGGPVSRHGVGFILASEEIWNVLISDQLCVQRREKDKQDASGSPAARTSVGGPGREPGL
jgi:hypothetical protein